MQISQGAVFTYHPLRLIYCIPPTEGDKISFVRYKLCVKYNINYSCSGKEIYVWGDLIPWRRRNTDDYAMTVTIYSVMILVFAFETIYIGIKVMELVERWFGK